MILVIAHYRTIIGSMAVSMASDGRASLTFPDLRPLLSYPDSQVMVAAAHVIGNMVKIAGANLGESFFQKEVGQAIQMIDDSRQEVGRFSAVLLLHQFALYAPGQFYPFIPRVLEKIWIPLRDSRTMVRERASMLLSACLDILKSRERSSNEIYRAIFEEAKSGLLKASSVDSILGSLLAFSAMLQNEQIVGCECPRSDTSPWPISIAPFVR